MSRKIVVQGGVNVQNMQLTGNKASYFKGSVNRGLTSDLDLNNQNLWEVILVNRKTGEQNRFRFGTSMFLGRSQDNKECEIGMVISNDMMVSKKHAAIFGSGDALYIKDINSRNHTYVNGEMVKEIVRLQQGDVIKVGATELCISYGKG